MKQKYSHYLKGIKYLDIINLEQKLLKIEPANIFEDQAFIDLSQCQFSELAAIAKLLLTIESLLKRNTKVYVALPTTQVTTNEKRAIAKDDTKKTQLIEFLIQKRIAANGFLKKTGFVSALQQISKIHGMPVLLTEAYDFEKDKINYESFEESFSVDYREYVINDSGYRFLLPFRWINCDNGVDAIASFEYALDKVLQHEDRGLDSIDVKSIKNVILSELIKNVHEHSKTKHALFSIGLINSKSLLRASSSRKKNPIEAEYLDWISDNKIASQVEIYFGDSGIGILNEKYDEYIKNATGKKTVEKSEQLHLAFRKWTTLKAGELRRGTKGLYRLHRIVKKYNGLVHIDTLGYDAGFFKEKPLLRKAHYPFQGTLVNIKLNPYKEITEFRYTISGKEEQRPKWVSEKFELNEHFDYAKTIQPYLQLNPNALLLLDITQKDLAIEAERKLLEELFYEISKDAEPTKTVIYLIDKKSKIDNDTIDILINSVQTRISEVQGHSTFPEIEHTETEEISDPILVIGDSNKAFWYGGSTNLIEILNESYAEGNTTQVNNLSSFKTLDLPTKKEIILYLRSSSTLINITDDHHLVFNFYGVENHYKETIEHAFATSRDENICTPKLHIVDKWVKMGSVLSRDEYGFALCLYLKYRDFKKNSPASIPETEKANTFILIDSSLQYGLAKKFVDLLGIRTKNIRNIESDIDFNIPKRTKLFPRGASVILLTTVISSSETVRRLVKYAKRDFSVPEVVLCLANFRRYNISHLETWSETTQILCCFQGNDKEQTKVDRTFAYFEEKNNRLSQAVRVVNPNMDFEKVAHQQNFIALDDELIQFLTDHKLLHYNHYGLYNKRHFTFFLNKSGIINTQSFIWTKITDVIDKWIRQLSGKNYLIYTKASFIGAQEPFMKFLTRQYPKKIVVLEDQAPINSSPNVIYLDFGILTGDVVNSFISRCYGVDNLFICILFNQSVNSNAGIFQKINTLRCRDPLTDKERATAFQIEYIFHLPLNYFTSENCPICEHRRALDFFKIDHDYLFKFSEDRQERLKQNRMDEMTELTFPVDFYYSSESKQQELSIGTIMQMYGLKILLENAKVLTQYRVSLYSLIFDLYRNIDEELKNSDSKVYSLIYYMSHEINWFQQEPLVFRDFRLLISKLAATIAAAPIENLIEYFSETNQYRIDHRHLATRYKYSAISVLRSTDKLVFCRELFHVISSFTNSGRSSNNLLQNCLYHVSSLFKNSYNKSELYYIEIANNLKRVKSDLTLTDEQASAIDNVLEENRKIRGSTILVGVEPGAFRMMKTEWERLYRIEMPRHPLPFEEFKALGLSQHRDLFYQNRSGDISEDEGRILKEITSHLKVHWENVKNYIDNNIVFYFQERLPSLTVSSYFSSKFSNLLNVATYKANADKFGQLVNSIHSSMNTYIDEEQQYESLFNYFLENYIQVKGLSNFSDDAKILHLLSDFPAPLNEEIDRVFSQDRFPRRLVKIQYNNSTLSSDEEKIYVYFPKSLLRLHFERIFENIKAKKNPGVDIADIDIAFVLTLSEAHMVSLRISYDSTDEFKKPENKNGSLNNFKSGLEQFGGHFTHELPDKENKQFTINLKFMRYE